MSKQSRAPLNLERPSKRAVGKDPNKAAQALVEGTARLVIDMAIEDHQRLKVRAAEKGQTMRSYVLQLLANDGIVTSTKL